MCPSGDQFCAEYGAVYMAMTNPPDADIAGQQDIMVRALVAGGVWTLLDVFYLFAQQSNAAGEALINWINPAVFTATLHGTINPAFTSLEGFTGNPAQGAYINSNYNPTPHGVNYTLNNACYGTYIRILGTQGAFAVMGVMTGAGIIEGYSWFLPNRGSSGRYAIINSGSLPLDYDNTDLGTHIITRSDANNVDWDTPLNLYDVDQVSEAISNENFYFLARNNNGVADSFYDGQLSCGFAGGHLDAAKRTILKNAVEAYMVSNGKGL